MLCAVLVVFSSSGSTGGIPTAVAFSGGDIVNLLMLIVSIVVGCIAL